MTIECNHYHLEEVTMKVKYLLPTLLLMASGGPLFATGEAEMADAGEARRLTG